MSAKSVPAGSQIQYRRILGIQFFVGNASDALHLGTRGGLVVVPAGPALMELAKDPEYRQALLGADLAITDSGFMVLAWNVINGDNIKRVSGLEYLRLLLAEPEFREPGAVVWVMPSKEALDRNVRWLKSQGHTIQEKDCYLAPKYDGSVGDSILVRLVNERTPRHVIICLGGGVQEKLGLYLKRNCVGRPAIHCIGAAIGFLTGDQVRIPDWADKWILGWLFRCVSNPTRFVPRYAKAWKLPMMLWKYHDQMPELLAGRFQPKISAASHNKKLG